MYFAERAVTTVAVSLHARQMCNRVAGLHLRRGVATGVGRASTCWRRA